MSDQIKRKITRITCKECKKKKIFKRLIYLESSKKEQ